mgnify:CR=1 FL=1
MGRGLTWVLSVIGAVMVGRWLAVTGEGWEWLMFFAGIKDNAPTEYVLPEPREEDTPALAPDAPATIDPNAMPADFRDI